MTSSKPYLIRAIYEWILDNGMTPHLVIDVRYPGVVVPTEFVEDGRLVLNVAPSAVRSLVMGNEHIQFNARFSGVARDVYFPVEAVLGIFTRENAQGMVFPEAAYPTSDEPLASPFRDVSDGPREVPGIDESTDRTAPSGQGKRKTGGPNLKLVK
ncbi:ClpXP protease specificity-enhancing factor [Thiocapsa imhoffii]|uniref:ClpXP protease specificity-enhancing factor n=2 Tax=Thiocapsa imhoffii TaxID=382777 RepID=A0A9X0WIY8_9GAMM|nr:ClpXP protease specificity-enhancing factor [Thiocapsa imhoffii]